MRGKGLALDGTGRDTFNELVLCTEEDDQLRQDGDEGQSKDLVPCETGITVHGQLDEQGHRVLTGSADVKQRTHEVVAAPHKLEQCAGHQSGAKHGHDDLVQGLEGGAAVDGSGFVQITGDIAHELHQLVDEVGLGRKCAVLAEICPDHVHMLVEIPPSISVSYFVGYLKGKSTLMIFERHANLKYKYGNRHFWCRGYYVDTVGKNAKKIEEYIANQLQSDLEYDQMTLKEYIDPFTGEPVNRNK